VKVSSGYDLTQLLIGSEGTLGVVTRVTLQALSAATGLVDHARAVPHARRGLASRSALVMSGVGPLLVEYIDRLTMMAITGFTGLSLGIPDEVRDGREAYLLLVVEGREEAEVQKDVESLGAISSELGAIDVFVLSLRGGYRAHRRARKVVLVGKQMGLTDIIDVVVPRASIPEYMGRVKGIAERHGTMISGCGHAGDGNVHLGIFQPDPKSATR